MNRDDIERMAREAKGHPYTNRYTPGETAFAFSIDRLEHFVSLVATAERDKYEAKFKQLEAIMQEREQQPNKPCCLAEREACAAWVRTNYMDHSVDSLCESLRARSNP